MQKNIKNNKNKNLKDANVVKLISLPLLASKSGPPER